MRGMIAAAYFMAIGYALAKTGADEELREIAIESYRRLVKHTMQISREEQPALVSAAEES
jgi:uncharacterized tellurite resistance protein B-like protein